MPYKWYGENVKKWMNENYDKRVNLAGEVVKQEMKRLLSNPGRTITLKTSKSGKVRKVYGPKGGKPSLPGEPPAKQSGGLFRSVFKKVNRRKNRVQVGAKGRALNSGVPSINLDPRPFVQIAKDNVIGQVQTILTSPLPDKK